MLHYLRCKKCGYDLYGAEYLANSIDPFNTYNQTFYSAQALLETCTYPCHSIECPCCHQIGEWTR